MAHIHLPDETNAPLEARGVLHDTRERWGFIPNIVRTFAIRPDIMAAEDTWSKAVMYEGTLPLGLKNAVAAVVSFVNKNDYCATSYSYAALRNGADKHLTEACRTLDFSDFEPRDKAVLEFAAKAARGSAGITAEDVREVQRHLMDQELIELVALIASTEMYNAWTAILGLEVEEHVHGESVLSQ